MLEILLKKAKDSSIVKPSSFNNYIVFKIGSAICCKS